MVGSGAIVFRIQRFEPIALISTFTAFVSLVMALLLIWVDLGHMGRAAYVIFFANLKSPMAWMILFYSGFLLVVTLQLLLLLRSELDILQKIVPAWQPGANLIRHLAIVGFILAIIFPTAVGVLFGVLAARPHWHSALIPILFLLSSVVSGCAALCVVLSIFQDGWRENRDLVVTLGRVVLIALAADVFFQVSELVIAFRSSVPGDIESIRLVMTGDFWWVFWVLQLTLGTIAPLMILMSRLRENPRWVFAATLLVAAGVFGFRLNVVIPGLAAEEIRGISHAIWSARLSAHYVPSVMEWGVVLGVFGFGMMLFGLGEKLLPKQSAVNRG
jgi:protein NrfD